MKIYKKDDLINLINTIKENIFEFNYYIYENEEENYFIIYHDNFDLENNEDFDTIIDGFFRKGTISNYNINFGMEYDPDEVRNNMNNSLSETNKSYNFSYKNVELTFSQINIAIVSNFSIFSPIKNSINISNDIKFNRGMNAIFNDDINKNAA